MSNIHAAINWKFGILSGVRVENDVLIEHPDGVPSEENQSSLITEYEEYLESIEYQKKRAVAYPPIADQLDKIYHDGIEGWKEQIKAVKDKYPKPE